MTTRSIFAVAALAFAWPVAAQQPTPTPTPEPAAETTAATPTPTPTPAPTPSYTATLPGEPDAASTDSINADAQPTYEATLPDSAIPAPTPNAQLDTIEPDLDPSLADPGPPPPAPTVQRNLNDIQPSKETIEKLNEEAIKQIQAFAKSQHNPNVEDLTLDKAISIALKQNPDVLDAIEQIRLTRGQLVEVRAQALPQITATSAYTQDRKSVV